MTATDLGLVCDGDNSTSAEGSTEDASPIAVRTKGFREAVTIYERNLVLDALERHRNNLTSAARELDLDRANFNRLAKRLGLK